MRSRLSSIGISGLAVLVLAGPALGAGAPSPPDSGAAVPALHEFHEVVFPLWHDAWPNKDYGLIERLLPDVKAHVERVRAAPLPEMFCDRKEDWSKGIESLAEAASRYEQAVESKDEKGMLEAVEALHSEFERLVRIVRPAMKELDAYHAELYGIYHKIVPAAEFGRLPEAAGALAARCLSLAAARVPERFAAREGEIRREISLLCRDTGALVEVASGGESSAVREAVETVHTQYRKVEAIFR